jgi:hypothetical protein
MNGRHRNLTLNVLTGTTEHQVPAWDVGRVYWIGYFAVLRVSVSPTQTRFWFAGRLEYVRLQHLNVLERNIY